MNCSGCLRDYTFLKKEKEKDLDERVKRFLCDQGTNEFVLKQKKKKGKNRKKREKFVFSLFFWVCSWDCTRALLYVFVHFSRLCAGNVSVQFFFRSSCDRKNYKLGSECARWSYKRTKRTLHFSCTPLKTRVRDRSSRIFLFLYFLFLFSSSSSV